ncbi:hypothetical protein ASG89_10805 [Paenibacillus sp. Soil766]|nr:hypothetical protein ASG89_10805 [Paenibacillus sp. Soil766]
MPQPPVEESEPEIEPPTDTAVSKPAKPAISNDNGWDNGVLDGTFHVVTNLWWGENARVYKLYENDVLIDTQLLTAHTPGAQTITTIITNRQNGTYKYYAELSNDFGTTRSDLHEVTVSQALPAKPVIASDNWDGDGNYTVRMDMWWGTNGTTFNLYENNILIHTQNLADTTPAAQSAEKPVTNKAVGDYVYQAELVNAAGSTRSDVMTVHVTK